jgi:hypothetical protein
MNVCLRERGYENERQKEVIQPRIFYFDYPNFGSCYHSNTYFFPSILYSNNLNSS